MVELLITHYNKTPFTIFYKIKQLKYATFLIQYNEDKICPHLKGTTTNYKHLKISHIILFKI